MGTIILSTQPTSIIPQGNFLILLPPQFCFQSVSNHHLTLPAMLLQSNSLGHWQPLTPGIPYFTVFSFGLWLQSLKGSSVFNVFLLQSICIWYTELSTQILNSSNHHPCQRLPNPKEKSLFSLLEIQGLEKSNLHSFAGPSPQRSHHSMHQYRGPAFQHMRHLFSHQFNFFYLAQPEDCAGYTGCPLKFHYSMLSMGATSVK